MVAQFLEIMIMETHQQPVVSAAAPSQPLGCYTSVADWQQREAGAFFETRASVDWFIKRHRQELVEIGALIPRAGRAGSLINRELFPKAVLAILRRSALDHGGDSEP